MLSTHRGQHCAPLTPRPADAPHALSPGALSAAMESRKQNMELLSNSMAAYAHIRANPESFGLYFVLGVCFGLVLTLCLLLLRISCRPRAQRTARPGPADLSEDDDDDDDEDEEEDTVDRAASESLLPMTEIPSECHGPGDGAPPVNVFASAEELERAQRLEERERIIREIWRNGQPDLLGALLPGCRPPFRSHCLWPWPLWHRRTYPGGVGAAPAPHSPRSSRPRCPSLHLYKNSSFPAGSRCFPDVLPVPRRWREAKLR